MGTGFSKKYVNIFILVLHKICKLFKFTYNLFVPGTNNLSTAFNKVKSLFKYWPFNIGKPLDYIRNNFNYLWHINLQEWNEMYSHIYANSKYITKGLKPTIPSSNHGTKKVGCKAFMLCKNINLNSQNPNDVVKSLWINFRADKKTLFRQQLSRMIFIKCNFLALTLFKLNCLDDLNMFTFSLILS